MRLGTDALKYPGGASMTPIEIVESAAGEGLAGVFYRTMLTMSPTLDPGYLREVRAHVDEHGMYLESGLGKVNPYGLPETPEVRALGDGDTVLGFRRMMEAAAQIGISELWVSTANIKTYSGRFAYDRFRTDVTWSDQLVAIEKFLRLLSPIARDNGIHMNLETHEEITSFELVRLVEAVGPDTVGITFDTANVVQRAEHPTLSARRVAPYVRQMHLKDTALFTGDDGILYQMRPNGEGVVDLDAILPLLYEAHPDLHLSLELKQENDVLPVGANPSPRRLEVSLYDPEWLAGHPDLNVTELVAYLGLVRQYEKRAREEGLPSYDEYANTPFDYAAAVDYLRTSVANVRAAAARAGIVLDGVPAAAPVS
ncbi:sugar phosphate isomerase [Frondihabitans sucicola]|uniref:Sugar phosphate isomerase n=1 Tax=Frondihabitans sucicola TaxID=1268041 RepID=A0ABM8GSQ5_9MICO|nr:sugar phosphate isomerase/epimerase family protein [Frondihabitans sucicola]BDZ51333.1 sugar phosphate isomerase [Frondihabitans sucicola]